jgi:hypothetical protein
MAAGELVLGDAGFRSGIDRSDNQCSGIVKTKAEAVRLVEETYQVCLREPKKSPPS